MAGRTPQKMRDYLHRMERKGLKRITVFVPADQEEEIKALCRDRVEMRLARIVSAEARNG